MTDVAHDAVENDVEPVAVVGEVSQAPMVKETLDASIELPVQIFVADVIGPEEFPHQGVNVGVSIHVHAMRPADACAQARGQKSRRCDDHCGGPGTSSVLSCRVGTPGDRPSAG